MPDADALIDALPNRRPPWLILVGIVGALAAVALLVVSVWSIEATQASRHHDNDLWKARQAQINQQTDQKLEALRVAITTSSDKQFCTALALLEDPTKPVTLVERQFDAIWHCPVRKVP